MTDPNLLFSPDFSLNLLSKSSPSQLQPFQYKRSRTQPTSTEILYSTQKTAMSNNSNNLKPSNLSHVPCKFYKQGTCTAGANCTFSHSSDLSSESAVCKYFIKGNCKFGTKCALLHTMSPFGTNGGKSGSNNTRMAMASTPPQPNALGYTGRRKTTDQTIPLSSSIHNSNNFDHRSFLNDPFFGSSAPAVPLFHQHYQQLNEQQQQQQQNVWRNQQSPRTNMVSNDFIGLHSSPRESSDYLLGTSPFTNHRLSSSVRSNSGMSSSGLFNNTPTNTDYRRHLMASTGSMSAGYDDSSHSSFFSHSHHLQQYDLNDAMLPSSLNDLFTPTELQLRRVRQQEQQLSYSPSNHLSDPISNWSSSRDVAQSSLDVPKQSQSWRVPFLTKSSQNSSEMLMTLPADYEDRLAEGTAAINIPSNNKSSILGTSNSTGSSGDSHHSYLQPKEEQQQQQQHQDDEVQFFMEDDEAVIMYDTTKNHKTLDNMTTSNSNTNYTFPSLVTLPST